MSRWDGSDRPRKQNPTYAAQQLRINMLKHAYGSQLRPYIGLELWTWAMRKHAAGVSVYSLDGLAWDENGLDIVSVRSREPNLDAIIKLRRERDEATDVSIFVARSFNKPYLVRAGTETNHRAFILQISPPLSPPPVHPHAKTRGEVTTLRFQRRETDVLVPEGITYNDSGEN
ncbi:hypothetical protein BDW68DRAFT_173742 [Aspergillus falconensis]